MFEQGKLNIYRQVFYEFDNAKSAFEIIFSAGTKNNPEHVRCEKHQNWTVAHYATRSHAGG